MGMNMNRRTFLGAAALAAASVTSSTAKAQGKAVRVGVIGTGGRGSGLLGMMLAMKDVAVPAICDISPEAAKRAQDMVEKAGQPRPEAYTKDEHAYRDLLARADLDAVIIATYWQWHTPMAVDAMKAGKYVGVEVPAAMSFDECWALVDTHEATKSPCMMLENWSFRRDNLAVLNMIRAGLFGRHGPLPLRAFPRLH